MPTPELDVLKPIDPSVAKSEDDYEIYTLSNAQIVYERNGKPANLLSAYLDTPLRVEGRLEAPGRSQHKNLLKKPFRPIDIEIRNVTKYAYAQTGDGEIVVWALGSAGWFEIRPSRNYKDLFADIVQAVEILYFVTDIYNEPRKRGGGPNASLVFQEYAEDKRFNCKDSAEAEERFYKHRAFLIICFLTRAEGVGWSNTPIFRHFRTQYPKEWETARARKDGTLEIQEVETKKTDSAPPKSTSKTKTKIPKTQEAPKKDDNWWEAAVLFSFMQKAVNLRAMHIGHVTIDKVAKLLVKRYEIDDTDTARKVIIVHAPNLLYMIEHPKRGNGDYLADEPIYEELALDHRLPAAERRRASAIELRPRKDYSSLKEDATSSSDSESSLETPKQQPRHKKKGRLSVLRPKFSKFSGKGKSVKQGKGKAPNVNLSSSASGSEDDSEMEIDTPLPVTGKRKLLEDTNPNPRKRAASASIDAEPSSPPSTSSSSPDTATEPLPLQWRSRNNNNIKSEPPLLPPVVSTPLPEYTANGPGDSWLCTFDGCSQKVYAASSELGRGLIQEHLVDHVRGREREVAIVMREEQKLRLPVNNLIKRIREMTEAQTPLFPAPAAGGGPAMQKVERLV